MIHTFYAPISDEIKSSLEQMGCSVTKTGETMNSFDVEIPEDLPVETKNSTEWVSNCATHGGSAWRGIDYPTKHWRIGNTFFYEGFRSFEENSKWSVERWETESREEETKMQREYEEDREWERQQWAAWAAYERCVRKWPLSKATRGHILGEAM